MKPGAACCSRAVEAAKVLLSSTSAFPLWRCTQTLRPPWHRCIAPSNVLGARQFASLGATRYIIGREPMVERHRGAQKPGSKKQVKKQLQGRDKPQEGTVPGGISSQGQELAASLLDILREYPTAPKTLFTAPELCFEEHSLPLPGAIKKSTSRSKQGGRQCTYSFKSEGKGVPTYTTSASAPSAKVAARLAAGDLVKRLHHTGLLKDAFAIIDEPTEEELNGQYGNILSVYNYCATIPAVPKVNMRLLAGNKDGAYELCIELPEHEIRIEAKCKTAREAEAVASIRFKTAVETYHSLRGNQPAVSSNTTCLTTTNAANFIEYYRGRTGQLEIEFGHFRTRGFPQSVDSPVPEQTFFKVNGEEVGEPAMIPQPHKDRSRSLAMLMGAIALGKANPELLEDFMRAKKGSDGTLLKRQRSINLVLNKTIPPIMAKATKMASWPSDLQDRFGFAATNDNVMDEEILDEDSVEDEVDDEEPGPFEMWEQNQKPRSEFRIDPKEVATRSARLKQRQERFYAKPRLEGLRNKKAELPMNLSRSKVQDIIERNQYSIIVGATGSGKSTQVPQIILEDGITRGYGARVNIICTQPRRIAAITVATRVASERDENIGNTVGYHVRHDRRLPRPSGSITYCTTGILLRQLQMDADEVLDTTSHIIMDEVHERDLQSDFLLTILKQALEVRRKAKKPVPKLVLMSATIDPELFSRYLENTTGTGEKEPCPWLSVPGRTFPVNEMFLDDMKAQLDASHSTAELSLLTDPQTLAYLEDEKNFRFASYSSPPDLAESNVPVHLVAATIAHIAKTSPEDGAILVFLPGLAEIKHLHLILLSLQPLGVNFEDASRFKLCLVHSSLKDTQLEPFKSVPAGCRKIIISTNIAETSITIPDVQHVVDSGKYREKGYNHVTKMTSLSSAWISKSNSKQRAGRAGRVQNGKYYALFSKARYDSFKTVQTPEMHRSDLQEICLQIKRHSFQIPIRDFLAAALEPPPSSAVDSAIESLEQLEALEKDEQLTPLGRVLSTLPLHPSLGKMVILGITFRCFDALLILSAATGGYSLFAKQRGSAEQLLETRLGLSRDSQSDHITTINAFRIARQLRHQKGSGALRKFASSACINLHVFEAIDQTTKQVEDSLVRAGVIPSTDPHRMLNSQRGPASLNKNGEHVALIKALAVSCFSGNISAIISPRLSRTRSESGAVISSASINGVSYRDKVSKHRPGDLHLFSEMTKTDNAILLRDTSEISPLMVALFGGQLEKGARDSSGRMRLIVDGWITLNVKIKDANTLVAFRKSLDSVLATSFRDLSRRRRRDQGHNNTILADDAKRNTFVESLATILQLDDDASLQLPAYQEAGQLGRGHKGSQGW